MQINCNLYIRQRLSVCKSHAVALSYLQALTLRKFVAENYTEKFDALKFTLKNNIKGDSTENHTETIPLLFRNAQNR